MSGPTFVNPYTFIPHVPEPVRARPAGHEGLGPGRLTGALRVRLRARTPLLVGGFEATATGEKTLQEVPRSVTGRVMVPGSGLHGAFRSLHETLTGSCLRVLNDKYVPVHRQGAYPGVTSGLKMAIVTQVDDKSHLPSEVALCDRVVWLDAGLLADHGEAPLKTGDRFALPDELIPREEKGKNAKRIRVRRRFEEDGVPGGVDPGALVRCGELLDGGPRSEASTGSWVLLVTDTRARSGDSAWFAAGRVGPSHLEVSPDAHQALIAALKGADDLRPAHERDALARAAAGAASGPGGDLFAPVCWPVPREGDPASGRVIGKRLRVSTHFRLGQPVWVKTGPGAVEQRDTGTATMVTQVRLSQLWRAEGSHPVSERVGGAGPCCDPDRLCPSCRVFGSADPNKKQDDDVARQRSYQGHVRVMDALVVREVEPLAWTLAPLSSPRPSAGQFYLDNTGLSPHQQLASNTEPPAAFWGSKADVPGPRPIRGRKFYWRTTPPTGEDTKIVSRGRARPHHASTLTRQVELIPVGSEFLTTVSFENLAPAELGSLLGAIDPRLVWPDDDVVISVGGGKPFGFGAVTATVEHARIETAAGRYLGEPETAPSVQECVQAFTATASTAEPDPGQATEAARQQWPGLRNALTLNYVDDALVWYPPGEGERDSAEYDQGFEFWKRSTGVTVDREERWLVCLPPPSAPAEQQVLAVPPLTDQGKKPQGGRGRGGR